MSRITTSRASLSWAMPAMRRACSSGVSGSSNPFLDASVAAVQALLRDQPCHRGRNQTIDVFAPLDTVANVARRDVDRLDLEEEHALGPRELHEDVVEPFARIPRSRGHGEPRLVEHALRILPGREVTELVRADHEDRVVPVS